MHSQLRRQHPPSHLKLSPATVAHDASNTKWRRAYVARSAVTALVMAAIATYAAFDGEGLIAIVAALIAAEYGVGALEARACLGRWKA